MPLGLLSVGTVIKNAGHEVEIIDADLLDLTPEQVLPLVKDADIVGLTAMTPSYPEAVAIANLITDAYPKKWTIIGGVHASIFPKQVSDTKLFNAVVVGPGESSILRVLRDIIHHPDRRPTVYSPIEQKTALGIPNNELFKLIPDYSLVDVLAYKPRYPHGVRDNWTIASTSRGCPWGCTFCSKAVFGHRYRYMPPGNVIQLLTDLYNDYGIRDITFYDDEFTISADRTNGLCSELFDSGLDITFTCESRIDSILKPALSLSLLKDAGCRLIYFGIESGNQSILNTLNKRTTLPQIREAIAMTQDAGIQAAGYFMFGAPGETKETIKETIDFSRSLNLDHAQFSTCSPLPGSKLYDEYVKTHDIHNWQDFQYLSKSSKVMFTTDELTADYLEKVTEEANAYYYEAVK